ncbi:MAG: Stp1/IreP family PP2C-type Ser/Thr phosphatase [Mycoplasmatota bacterium]|nr:Stp1/IreP family PP2C-type Ser/Thr phosphatase [Mycoplasmatota bacterium]
MQTFYFTDPGKVRSHNEDSVTIINNDKQEFVLAIADGMGGHKAGEVASTIAIEHIRNSFYKLDTMGTKEDAIEWLRKIVKEINAEIFAYAKDNPESKGLGTTLVIAIKTNDYILYGNIGDSSGYVIKNNTIHKVTKDHTYVGMLLNNGRLTEEEALNHPGKNLLTRALGANDPIEIDIFDVDTSVKGLFLCSDGLTNMLTDEQIEKILNSNLQIEEVVIKLVKKANSRGGTDNISIAYLKKESGEQ